MKHVCTLVILCWAGLLSAGEHPAAHYGLPDTGGVLQRKGYVVSYDGRTRQPRWAIEKLTRKSLLDNATRKNPFKADPDVPGEFAVGLKDYEGSGYDRGHLAPSANHQASQTENDETFYLSNMSPQLPDFNRGIWKELESDVRRLLDDGPYVELYVLSGPLFLPSAETVRYRTIGDNHVAVPTHFFKSVLLLTAKGEYSLRTWILPHKPLDAYEPYRVSVDELESAAGFDAWPGLPAAVQKRLEAGK